MFDTSKHTSTDDRRWVTGEMSGLEIPADAASLLSGGCGFLTRAFHSSGALPGHNKVSRIIEAKEFHGGGTGKKLVLTLAYEQHEPALPTRLCIKFSRNFEIELRDRARNMMVSEARFAMLSRIPDFPVTVPLCLFADVEPVSGTGLIVTECIAYGRNGIEAHYPKCRDYVVPEPVEHYRVILRELARLSGTHRAGRLPREFDQQFPYNLQQAAARFTVGAPVDKLVQRANRMFDFIERYPRLCPDIVRAPQLRAQFLHDIPDLVAAQDRIQATLFGNPDFIAFAHWNANIDNCWFWRDAHAQLQCGFLDWANAGRISLAQSINGAISGAEPFIWNDHLDELLLVYIEDYAARGGARLDLDALRLHVLLIVAVSGVAYAMGAPVAIEREVANLDAVASYKDAHFAEHETARIQLHMMTKTLNVWHTRQLGDVIRRL